MISMIRTIITSVIEGAIKRFSGAGRPGETITGREYFQHYGFTSRPKAGAEMISLKTANVVIAVASDDRRYRLALDDGEVALYTDEGDCIHFKRGKEIYIKTGAKLTVEASAEVEITAPSITLTGDVTVDGGLEVTGAMHAVGDITSDGLITDTTGNTNHHVH